MPLPRNPITADSEWGELIRAKGLRATRAAVSVLKTIHGMDVPVSHDDLQYSLSQQKPASVVDSVTLYRILDRLSHVKLIDKVLGSDRVWRYTGERDQLNDLFECESCHQHFNLPRSSPLVTLLEQFSNQLKRKGDAAFEISFNVHGRCNDCS